MGHLLDMIRDPKWLAEREAEAKAQAEEDAKRREQEEAAQRQHRVHVKTNTVRDSLNNLHEEGWSETTRENVYEPATYPHSGRIVLEHPCQDYALVYTYSMSEDSSDYPGDNVKIAWRKADFVERVVYDVVCR